MSGTAGERPPGTFRFVVTGNNAQRRSYFVRDEFMPLDSEGQQVPPLFQTTPDQLATFMGMGGAGDATEVLAPFPLTPAGWGVHEDPNHGAVTLGYFQLPTVWDAYFERGAEV